MPKGAKCRTARNAEERADGATACGAGAVSGSAARSASSRAPPTGCRPASSPRAGGGGCGSSRSGAGSIPRSHPTMMFAPIDGTERRSCETCGSRRGWRAIRSLSRCAARSAASITLRSRWATFPRCRRRGSAAQPFRRTEKHGRAAGPAASAVVAVRAPFGIPRRLAFRAVRHSAPLLPCAVWALRVRALRSSGPA